MACLTLEVPETWRCEITVGRSPCHSQPECAKPATLAWAPGSDTTSLQPASPNGDEQQAGMSVGTMTMTLTPQPRRWTLLGERHAAWPAFCECIRCSLRRSLCRTPLRSIQTINVSRHAGPVARGASLYRGLAPTLATQRAVWCRAGESKGEGYLTPPLQARTVPLCVSVAWRPRV